MLSIFGLDLADVTYEDVESFCQQQLAENQYLDYKEAISPSLLKTICAFANTVGGWIIIGVKDDKDKPVLPVVGLPAGINYRQKIVNMLVEGMHPIAIPEIKEYVSQDSEKVLVVINVDESRIAPHWTKDDKLYIRIADRTKTDDRERLAHSTEWENLRNRRQLAEEIRGSSLDVLSELFNQFRDIARGKGDAYKTPQMHSNKLKISIGPLFPRTELIDIEQAVDTCMTKAVDVLNYSPGQIPSTHHPIRTFQTGAYVVDVSDEIERDYFFAIDTKGYMMLIIHCVEKMSGSGGVVTNIVRLGKIIAHVDGMLRFAKNVYSDLGYAGNLQLRTQILLHPGTQLLAEKLIRGGNDTLPIIVPGAFSDLKQVKATLLNDEVSREEIVYDVAENLKYAFNAPYLEISHFQDLLARSKPRKL